MSTPTEDAVRAAPTGVLDPEIGINVVDLGLVYAVTIDGDGWHHISNPDGTGELHDVRSDPWELEDRAADPSAGEHLERCRALLREGRDG